MVNKDSTESLEDDLLGSPPKDEEPLDETGEILDNELLNPEEAVFVDLPDDFVTFDEDDDEDDGDLGDDMDGVA